MPLRPSSSALIAAAIAASLSACGADTSADRAAPSPSSLVAPPDAVSATNEPAGSTPADETPDTASLGVPEAALAVPPPGPEAVREAAFATDAAARSSSAFWQGQRFALDGVGLYVGFAVAEATGDAPSPDQTVAVAQATWRFADGAWRPVSASTDVGRIGGGGRAPTVDGAQDARVFQPGGGRVLLALPTAEPGSSGVVVYAYELFAAEGDPLAWRHVGRVPAGSDNRAGCSEAAGAAIPCASAAGTLEFQAGPGGAWPALRLALQGTTVEGPGAVRGTTASDVVTLGYDDASGRYVPTAPIPDAAY